MYLSVLVKYCRRYRRKYLIMSKKYNKIFKKNLLETLVMHFPLVAGDGVAQAGVVARVHYGAAYLAETRLARHDKERRVEQGVVLA